MAFAPLIAAGIAAAGSVAAAKISADAQSGAAGAAGLSGAQALARNTDIANRDVGRTSPWQASGSAAAQQINALLGLGSLGPIGDQYNTYGTTNGNWQQDQKDALAKFQTDPGYLFRFNQGQQAVQNSGAARGNTFSGAQAKALTDYGQAAGSAEYGNYFNRLAGVSGQGLTAANDANMAYNQAMNPGSQNAFAGGQSAAGYGAAGGNASASGLLGGVNSLAAGIGATDWSKLFGKGTDPTSVYSGDRTGGFA